MIGIYVHIPFCLKKCLYCDFVSFVQTQEVKKAYVDALLKEIDSCPVTEIADTVFLGGGTPSVLDATDIDRILNALYKRFRFSKDYECTIEMNPGTVSMEKFKAYRNMGINRLSIGLQSCNDTELQCLGRIHTRQEFEKAYFEARECGFENINVDLMSAIPGQSLQSYSTTLQKVLSYRPEHISAYSLIVEEGTPFASQELDLPDEDAEREMYYLTKEMLEKCGYKRYEISNYALSGYTCRHNLKYWKRSEYLGFGIAAASFYGGERRKNGTDLFQYLQNGPTIEESVLLGREDEMSEFFYLGLRMTDGVSEQNFVDEFGVKPQAVFPGIIEKHITNGLLEKNDDRIILTKKGLDVSNYVLCDFLLD